MEKRNLGVSPKIIGSWLRIKLITEFWVIWKDRVSYEVNSIGATGAKPPLLGRTAICIGARIVQPAQR
jgi:hypothetical protein